MLEHDWIGTESDGGVGARAAIRDHEEATDHVRDLCALSHIDAGSFTQSRYTLREGRQL